MLRISLTWLAVLLASGAMPQAAPTAPSGEVPAASQLSPERSFDVDAEQQLFALANQARTAAGAQPLQLDEGLTQAARTHAAAMASQQQLSHQLPGEPSLEQRLAATSGLHLDRAGENVSYSTSVEQAQDSLMHSPPHRANLLNSEFNYAGFGVARRGAVLYVVQDFAHALSTATVEQAGMSVIDGVLRIRRDAHLPELRAVDSPDARAVACSMAHADSLAGAPLPGRYTLRYTTMQPQDVPPTAARAIDNRGLSSVATGACYARTPGYPNGVYWVVVVLN